MYAVVAACVNVDTSPQQAQAALPRHRPVAARPDRLVAFLPAYSLPNYFLAPICLDYRRHWWVFVDAVRRIAPSQVKTVEISATRQPNTIDHYRA